MITTASCWRECTRCFCFASPSNFAFTRATGITIHINSCPVKCGQIVATSASVWRDSMSSNLQWDVFVSQLVQPGAAFLEADQRRRAGGPAQNPGGEQKQLQPQRAVARAESTLALGAVIIS